MKSNPGIKVIKRGFERDWEREREKVKQHMDGRCVEATHFNNKPRWERHHPSSFHPPPPTPKQAPNLRRHESTHLLLLPAAGAARLAQNTLKCLQVAPDGGGHSQRRVESRSQTTVRVPIRPSTAPEPRRHPDPGRFPPGARVAAPSGSRREAPPTAVRHFNSLSALASAELGGRRPETCHLHELALSPSGRLSVCRFRGGAKYGPRLGVFTAVNKLYFTTKCSFFYSQLE